MTGDLAAFLNARLDEDETAARKLADMLVGALPDAVLAVCFDDGTSGNAYDWNPWDHISDYDPARVLRDVEADRKLLAELARAMAYSDHVFATAQPGGIAPGDVLAERCRAAATVLALEVALKIRAERFSDHPDYREAWKP